MPDDKGRKRPRRDDSKRDDSPLPGPERLPQALEAERSVLGSMLRDNQVIGDLVQVLRAESFYLDAHQKIFLGIISLYDRGLPVDLVVLSEELKQRGEIENIGGYAYLGDLWTAAPTAAMAEHHARIVRDRAVVRNLIHASTEILRDAYDNTSPADELVGTAERKILEVAQLGITGQTFTLEEALADAYDRIDARTTGDKMSTAGLRTGFADLDEITAGLQNSEMIIVAARPSVGKCLAHDAEIVLEDGSIATIEDIYRARQARLLTLEKNWRLGVTEPSAFVDDGIKPVYRVTTRLGRRVETTLSHPFLTLDGWMPLASLRVGERIAVPRHIPIFGSEQMRECEVKLLAYLLGDGCLTDTTPEFTNGNPRLRTEFSAAVLEFGGLRVRVDDSNGTRTPTVYVASDWEAQGASRVAFGGRLKASIRDRVGTARTLAATVEVSAPLVTLWCQGKCAPTPEVFGQICRALGVADTELAPEGLPALRKNEKNALTRWLDSLGLWGKNSHDKFIPPAIFRLPRTQLALFVNRLFATDGWASVQAAGNAQFGYASVSEQLIRQLQHLLLRFGILASLRKRAIKYRGGLRVAWQLEVTHQESIRLFADEIGIFGKEEAVSKVANASARKRRKVNRDLIPVGVWKRLDHARAGQSWAEVGRRAGAGDAANLHVGRRSLKRSHLARLAGGIDSRELLDLAESDVYWDEIVSIEPLGERQVYDLTIPTTHNFVANDVCVHNTAFALNFIRNILIDEKQACFFVSLEQSRIELAERLLCSQARVDGHRLRTGNLTGEDMAKLVEAGGVLRNTKLYIDDSPGQGMLRIAANARRLKLRQNLRLVVIDYLQLIEPENRRDPRQEQVAQISRRIKGLARELCIPVVALAQVNRAAEDRQDHRPRVSDLRESGCLTGDSLVTLADSGQRVPIRDLVGKSGFLVWALDEQTLKVRPAEVSNAFSTGRKPVLRLRTRLGREIRATGNHPFRKLQGWCRLAALTVGASLAVQASDGVVWDEVVAIIPDGEEEVFDLTVPGPANFVANGIIVHNSIEQDADTIMLLHRPERYEPGQHEGIVEVIIGKQRNGPVGEITLSYIKQFMRFENYRVSNPFEG